MKRHIAYPLALFVIAFSYIATTVVVQIQIGAASSDVAMFAIWAGIVAGLVLAIPLYFAMSPSKNRDGSVANVGDQTVGRRFATIASILILSSITGGAYVSYTKGKEQMQAAEALKKAEQKLADDKAKAVEQEKQRRAAMTPAERSAEDSRKADELAKQARRNKEAKEKADAQKLATQRAAEAAQNQILSKLAKKHDEVDGTDWYQDKTSPKYINQNGFYLYMGKKADHVWLHGKVQYAADKWLFIHTAIIKADDKTFTWVGGFQRDNDSRIWEWSDIDVNKDSLAAIRAIVTSKKAILRLEGRQYQKDRLISAQEKQAFKNVLDAYAALGGKD